MVAKSSIITSSHYIVMEKYQVSSRSLQLPLVFNHVIASNWIKPLSSVSFSQSFAIFKIRVSGRFLKPLHRFSSGTCHVIGDIYGNARYFSLGHSVKPRSGAQKTYYQLSTTVCTPRDKATAARSWPSTSNLCRGLELWSYTSIRS
jgi:hypothetical protein